MSKLQVDKFRCSTYRAIFTGLENSTHDLSLFWNAIGSLQKIFENNSSMALAMLDYIPETLTNILLSLSLKYQTYVIFVIYEFFPETFLVLFKLH